MAGNKNISSPCLRTSTLLPSLPPKLHQQEHKEYPNHQSHFPFLLLCCSHSILPCVFLQLISFDLSSKILKEALNQHKEILEEETQPQTLTSFSSIPPNHSIASDSGAESDDDVDASDGFSETLSHYDATPEEIDEEDEKVLAAFMSKDAGPQRTLADLIIQRIKEKDAQVTSGIQDYSHARSVVTVSRESTLVTSGSSLTAERWFWLFLIHATLLISPSVELVMINDSANTTDALALLAFKQQIRRDPVHPLRTWNDSLPVARNHMRLTPSSQYCGYESGWASIGSGGLILSNSSMIGEILANLTHCRRLRIISFGFNKLTGTIPVELGSLSRLKWLAIGSNYLTGSIPTSLGNLSSLTHFSLGTNELEGNIPKQLGQLRNLYFFETQDNKLSGNIPPTLFNLSSIAVISVPANQLRESLPPNLDVTLPNLVGFYVGGNQFTGPIPMSMSNASRLEQLELSENQFNGSIPTNLGRLGGLRVLNLEDNLLGSGEADDMSSLSSYEL
ncbi:hypothetical protein MRB53_004556 [Persea americana]|uniref:Uncharacterized protein n=1 Tax=Persea americana TaxID=3435 RepID=A0ACC2MBK6_PERAE|nr:hypothetical protein MRB53_004556 [Persea americana]